MIFRSLSFPASPTAELLVTGSGPGALSESCALSCASVSCLSCLPPCVVQSALSAAPACAPGGVPGAPAAAVMVDPGALSECPMDTRESERGIEPAGGPCRLWRSFLALGETRCGGHTASAQCAEDSHGCGGWMFGSFGKAKETLV